MKPSMPSSSGLQVGGDAEIGIALARRRLDLEDDGDHGFTELRMRRRGRFRKMRSSLRMNCSRRANS